MRATTETLSQVTNLLAIVSAPPIDTATIRHVEVLLLQPQVLMVVVITSTGGGHEAGASRSSARSTRAWPRGPATTSTSAWRASASARACCTPGSATRSLRATERGFLERLAPAFTELAETAEDTLYVDGAARLLSEHRFQDLTEINELMGMLERRVALLGVLRAALGQRDVLVRIGRENEAPALHSLALVAAGYGLPARTLGTVSVIGPVRMDYAGAIRTVREAAHQLSRFVEDVYEGCMSRHATPRSLRGARRRPRGRRDRDQEGLPAARARAAPRRQPPRPRRRGEVQGGRRGLRDPLRPRAPRDLRPLRPRGPALGRLRARTSTASARSPTSSTPSSAARFGAAARGGPMQGGDVAVSARGRRSRRPRPAPRSS